MCTLLMSCTSDEQDKATNDEARVMLGTESTGRAVTNAWIYGESLVNKLKM